MERRMRKEISAARAINQRNSVYARKVIRNRINRMTFDEKFAIILTWGDIP
jgi:hypothetical protein